MASPPPRRSVGGAGLGDTHLKNIVEARDRVSWLPCPWMSMGFEDIGGDQDAISEVSMGVSESEMYRAHVAKRCLDNRSPQQHQDARSPT